MGRAMGERSFEGLPELLAEIAEVAGLDAAIRLADARGGSRVHIPGFAPDGHWLVEVVGREAADCICDHFRIKDRCGVELLIPMGGSRHYTRARRRFEDLIGEGHSVAEAARRVGVHLRTARYWRARCNDDGAQGRLF